MSNVRFEEHFRFTEQVQAQRKQREQSGWNVGERSGVEATKERRTRGSCWTK